MTAGTEQAQCARRVKGIVAAVLASAAFIAPAVIDVPPASAAVNYGCVSNSTTPDCQYANRYVCSGSTWWAYRFWTTVYNFNGTVAYRYKTSYVERFTNGRPVSAFYVNGWSYSPC